MSINHNFKVGDKVQLKSGGPLMTVSALRENDTVECVWFHQGKVQTHSFFTVMLDEEAKLPETIEELLNKTQGIIMPDKS